MLITELNLNKALTNALDDLGIKEATNIQSKVFSVIMSGRDLVAIAPTGTGKTYAYLLPLLRMWKFSKSKQPQILVLVPTRELVEQTVVAVKELTGYMNFDVIGVYGGVNIKNQAIELMNGCDMIVATPGRFNDLTSAGVLKVKSIKKLVIDEFDTMLDLGFQPQLDLIFNKLPERKQNLMFSATATEEAMSLVNKIFITPEIIEAVHDNKLPENISHKAYSIPNFKTKMNFLEVLLGNDQSMNKNMVFVSTKALADYLFEFLERNGHEDIGVIHSNKSQNYRFRMIDEFSDGKIRTLIATDIGSRGLDIDQISHVINMDIPESEEDFAHRVGRTGRLNQQGIAISFISPLEEEDFTKINTTFNLKIEPLPLPRAIEVEDTLLDFEKEREIIKFPVFKPDKEKGDAFHEKTIQKVNKRRDVEAEKKLKYGKSYKKR